MPLSTHNSPVMPDWEGIALVEGILARKRMSLIVGGRGFGKNYRQAQMVREHALRQKVTASPTAQPVASIRYVCLPPSHKEWIIKQIIGPMSPEEEEYYSIRSEETKRRAEAFLERYGLKG